MWMEGVRGSTWEEEVECGGDVKGEISLVFLFFLSRILPCVKLSME